MTCFRSNGPGSSATDAKHAAIPGGGTVMDYNFRKQQVIRDIYDRIFRAAGML